METGLSQIRSILFCYPIMFLLSVSLLLAPVLCETTNTAVQTLSGTKTFVPVGASINADNHLVYTTVEGATTTLVYTDASGFLTTSIGGGHGVTTTADHNYATAEFTETTTRLATQHVGYGEYYTLTTYDLNGNPHEAYFKEDPNIQATLTSWDNDGKPHTYYLSASNDGFVTLDAASVTGMVASTPTTDSSLANYKATANTHLTGLATSHSRNDAGKAACGFESLGPMEVGLGAFLVFLGIF